MEIASLFRPGDVPSVADYQLFDALSDEQQRAAAVVLAGELEAIVTPDARELTAELREAADCARSDVLRAREELAELERAFEDRLFMDVREALIRAVKALDVAEEHLDRICDE